MNALELRRRWAALTARQRLDGLLDQEDARKAVRATSATDLYHAVREVGLADTSDLIELASPKQFRTLVDLGAWHKDRIEPAEVLTWLRAARGESTEDFLAKLHGLDSEVLQSVLRHYLVIHSLEETPDANPSGFTVETPEGKYLIEIDAEGVDLVTLRQLVNDLIAENPFESVRFFEALRWELPTELEEVAYRFRSARLADLGFPSLDEAMSLFTRVDIPSAGSAQASGALVPDRAAADYVGAAFAALDETERSNAEGELLSLINAVVVAEVSDPGDTAAVRRASEMARDYVALGFEQLSGGDVARAADVLRATPLRRIFQTGFTLTLRLKFRADELVQQPLARVGGRLMMMDETATAVAALRRKRPLRALRVPGADPVAFRSRRELAETEALLGRAQTQARVLSGIFGGTEAAIGEAALRCALPDTPLTAQHMFAAAVAWAVLESKRWVAPLPSTRLDELASRVVEGDAAAPRVRAAAAESAVRVLGGGLGMEDQGELRSMVDAVLAQLSSEAGAPYLRDGKVLPMAVSVLPVEPLPT